MRKLRQLHVPAPIGPAPTVDLVELENEQRDMLSSLIADREREDEPYRAIPGATNFEQDRIDELFNAVAPTEASGPGSSDVPRLICLTPSQRHMAESGAYLKTSQ